MLLRMRPFLACAALAAGLMMWGCSAPLDPVASTGLDRGASAGTQAGEGGLFFPLDIGNHWSYARTFSLECETCTPIVIPSTIDIDLIGTAERYGRPYVVWRESWHEPQNSGVTDWLYRQDRGGLYNADPEPSAAAVVPMAPEPVVGVARGAGAGVEARRVLEAAPELVARMLRKHALVRELALHGRILDGGAADARRPAPQAGEIALLRYPLHTHETWHVRDDPQVVYTVEGHELLDLPAGRFPAWRIRIDWPELFGPDDRAHVWYGPSGFLALRAHLVSQGTDQDGNPTFLIVSDETQVLARFSLVR